MAKVKTLETEINETIKAINKLEAFLEEVDSITDLNPFIADMANKAEWELDGLNWQLYALEQDSDPYYRLERINDCIVDCWMYGDVNGMKYFQQQAKEIRAQLITKKAHKS